MAIRKVAWVFQAGLMLLGSGTVSGQNYPERPVRIVTSEAGGNTDITARMIAPGLADRLGQPVIIENRSAIIAAETVASAVPHGYTMFAAATNFWTAPLLRKVSYDPARDFSPISIVSSSPSVLVVHPSLPANSVRELIALAKVKPGALNYSSGAAGGAAHLSAELFKAMAGINIVRVSYRGGAASLIAVLGGEVQLSFNSGSEYAQHVKAGRLKALAVTSAGPSALAPGLPTVAAAGLPGYESATTVGMFAPAKTPAAVITRLNQEIVRVLSSAEIKERLFNNGTEVVASSPEELAVAVKSEMARLGKVIKDAGIKIE